MFIVKLKSLLVAFGDLTILYGALALTLFIRYGADNFSNSLEAHLKPFSLIFIVWFLIFYLSDLYSDKFFKHNISTLRVFSTALAINVVLSIIAFYAFVSFFQLTPKTNLLIFAVIFGTVDYLWRLLLIQIFISGGWRRNILFVGIGNSPDISQLAEYLKNNPQTGYRASFWFKQNLAEKNFSDLVKTITDGKIELVIINADIKKNPLAAKFIYRLLPLEVRIVDFSHFYETIFQKVPLEEIEESWFVESITTGRHFYDAIKRFGDAILAFVLGVLFLAPIILISALIKLTSKGLVIYKQERVGKNDKVFTLYKFRTMKTGQNGPLATKKEDPRVFFIGKILRFSHLDELPQFYNILKGDISFIGPRPERKELAELYGQLPYYEIRHIIKPGLTGWAQVNYKPSASLEEAKEKLQYDIYYAKNRSLFLDFLIVLKTIKYIFVSHQ